jgi:8-oxo-dGTP pyrophosphatase MutT (NUDIX family)
MTHGKRFALVAAVHVLFVREGHVLLLRRANTGYEDGSYSVPAGHLDGGETVTEAAIREAFEETGIMLDKSRLEHGLVMHRRAEAERVDFFVVAKGWLGEPRNLEPEKCDDLAWHALDALPSNLVPYVRRAIEAFRIGERYVEFGWT